MSTQQQTGHFEVACPICKDAHELENARYHDTFFQPGHIPNSPAFEPEIASCNGEPYKVTPAILVFVPDEPDVPGRLTQQNIDDYNELPPHEKLKAWDSYRRLVEPGELEPFDGLIERPESL